MQRIIIIPILFFLSLFAMAQNALEPAVFEDFATMSNEPRQHYKAKRTKLLQLNKLSCGVFISRSFRNEGILGYDPVKHALVYHESIKSIWDQAWKESMILEKSDDGTNHWEFRDKPLRAWNVPVTYHQMRIPDDLAFDLFDLWSNAIRAAREDESQVAVLDGTSYEVFVRGANPMYARTNGCARRKAPEGQEYLVRRLLRLNRQLVEAVTKGKRRMLDDLRADIKFLALDFAQDAAVDDNGWKFRHAF
ncbi:MAG: hypothetical protein J5720_08740 [Bacteroidaceae bacterium]|nr:hypothetical protein [Bacteroidaceae bacterium]